MIVRASHPLAWPLDVDATPIEVLRALRHRERPVALIGDWAGGGALIAVDPLACTADLRSVDSQIDYDLSPEFSGDAGFVGPGWFGVFGYQLGRDFETLPPAPSASGSGPTVDIAYYPHILRFDRESRTWWFESAVRSATDHGDISRLRRRRDELVATITDPSRRGPRGYTLGAFLATPNLDGHRRALTRIIEHIRAGDIFQANVCLRLDTSFTGDPVDLFAAGVEELAPAYAAFVRTELGAIASLSPELFLERRGRHIRTAPIKGTAPRTADPAKLRSSAKDRAENVMIVDLMRNDLGRVSTPDSVTVPESLVVRPHAGVWHLVSEVRAELRDDVSDSDLISRTFPPGSVTGAPKVRAMELINTVEATARHAYTGAIGWASRSRLELNVAIRTFEFEDDRVWLGVGGGVIARSEVESEVAECFVKASPLLTAVGGHLKPGLATEVSNLAPGREPTLERPISTPRSARRHVANAGSSGPDRGPARCPVKATDPGGVWIAVYDNHVVLDDQESDLAAEAVAELQDKIREAGLPVLRRPLDESDRYSASELFRWPPNRTPGEAGSVRSIRSWLTQPAHPTDLPKPSTDAFRRASVLVIDNYDSFVFNLARYCEVRGAAVEVVRNDQVCVDHVLAAIEAGEFDRVLLSPGPGVPRDAGICVELVTRLPRNVPLLGVCLGHQAIAEAFGGSVVLAPEPVHGMDTIVCHDARGVFAGLYDPLIVGRYHSLVVDLTSLARTGLEVSATSPSGLIMGLRHRSSPVEGVQFHPESVLTPLGGALIANFLAMRVRC